MPEFAIVDLTDARDRLPRPWVTREEAAEYLNVSLATIDRWRAENALPTYKIRGTSLIRLRREDLDALPEPVDTVPPVRDVER
jgi:excisionase family DNA binding protein